MKITFIDDSVEFDGESPDTRPLGGTQKAVAGLARALAGRGLDATVINRCAAFRTHEGVTWQPWDMARPESTDVLVVVNRPRLLGEIAEATHRILWLHAAPKFLGKSQNQEILDKYDPRIVFQERSQFADWNPWRNFRRSIVEPGLSACFRDAEPGRFSDRGSRALITTHPLHGLDGLVRLWRDRIFPQAPGASLHVFSAALARGMAGEAVDPALEPVFELVRESANSGVVVERPGSDPVMRDHYLNARIHLYPAIEGEAFASTLAESQACGLPAVALRSPATEAAVRDGQTGYLVPDTDAMVNLSVQLLTYPAVGENLSRDGALLQSARGWEMAAAEFVRFWS